MDALFCDKDYTKSCVKCKEIKFADLFGRDKHSKDGLARMCKICQKQHSKDYRDKNLDRIKARKFIYYENNKEKILSEQRNKKEQINSRRRQYYKNNAEKFKERNLTNKENIKRAKSKYRANNKDKIKSYDTKNKVRKNKQKVEQRKLNQHKRVQHCLQTRIRLAINSSNGKKLNRTEELIGCTVLFYKEYLESKFTKGMGWENYGIKGWHIDHIIPCASFDLADIQQQKLCFHYTNTQPLWATNEIAVSYGESSDYIGNLEKQDKIISENK